MLYGTYTDEQLKSKLKVTVKDLSNIFNDVKMNHWNNHWTSWASLEEDLIKSILVFQLKNKTNVESNNENNFLKLKLAEYEDYIKDCAFNHENSTLKYRAQVFVNTYGGV